jgi:tetratricopeptide (TPR) repeat protein
MVKSNGKWKITNAITTEISMYQQPNEEMTLNNAGYAFLAANKVDEAIQIFQLNTKLFPDSYNVWDSLGEAYAKADKKDLAIQNYEKSIQLNPKRKRQKGIRGSKKVSDVILFLNNLQG